MSADILLCQNDNMPKTITARISPDHTDGPMVMLLDSEPELGDEIIFMEGCATVNAINTNYKGSDETWLGLEWSDKTTEQYRYVVRP